MTVEAGNTVGTDGTPPQNNKSFEAYFRISFYLQSLLNTASMETTVSYLEIEHHWKKSICPSIW
jgi:hypothetical protein